MASKDVAIVTKCFQLQEKPACFRVKPDYINYRKTVQVVPDLWWFEQFFNFMMVQKQYIFSRNRTSNFDLFPGQQNLVRCCPVMLGSGSDPKLPVSHAVTRVHSWNLTAHCVVSVFWILCLVLSHPITSKKHPSVSPAPGEKKRKAIALEMKLEITAQQ